MPVENTVARAAGVRSTMVAPLREYQKSVIDVPELEPRIGGPAGRLADDQEATRLEG